MNAKNSHVAKPIVFGSSSVMNDVLKATARIAPSDATVLITGETGTGKEMMARVVHEKSQRAAKAFVPMNCAAIPEALLESELFGHARGAFTGAVATRRGRLAMADGGTLFLDEVGELPLSLQVKLLRVLQERVYEPVGSNESVSANFRLVAATNRDLATEVEAGRFRRDLYYRLMVCPIELPALRDRRGDVVELLKHFWAERGEARPFEAQALETLERYSWPGNVRELENLVERISVLAEGTVITSRDLPWQVLGLPSPRPTPAPYVSTLTGAPSAPVALTPPSAPATFAASAEAPMPAAPPALTPPPPLTPPSPITPDASFPVDLPTLLRRMEDQFIDAALQLAHGNKKAAADLLGLQRTTLVEKLRRRQRDSMLELPTAVAASAA